MAASLAEWNSCQVSTPWGVDECPDASHLLPPPSPRHTPKKKEKSIKDLEDELHRVQSDHKQMEDVVLRFQMLFEQAIGRIDDDIQRINGQNSRTNMGIKELRASRDVVFRHLGAEQLITALRNEGVQMFQHKANHHNGDREGHGFRGGHHFSKHEPANAAGIVQDEDRGECGHQWQQRRTGGRGRRGGYKSGGSGGGYYANHGDSISHPSH
jgi:hypothetical protein